MLVGATVKTIQKPYGTIHFKLFQQQYHQFSPLISFKGENITVKKIENCLINMNWNTAPSLC